MPSLDRSTRVLPARLAAAARSILACPSAVNLVVDGVDDVLAGDEALGMQDLGGIPTFSCVPDSPLARAAQSCRSALLTIESGLGVDGTSERSATLTLAGRLALQGEDDCYCCGEVRLVVTMDLNFALLARADDADGEQQFRVPLSHFRSSAHDLNRGYLQRSVEHANHAHQEELRRAIATTSGTRFGDIVGVALSDLRPDRVQLGWVDVTGAHSRELRFSRTATTARELGDLLRKELHAGLC